MKKFIKLLGLILLIVLILGIVGTSIYKSQNYNIWGLNNNSNIEFIKTNNINTLNNVQNILLNNYNVITITKDGSDYHIFLKNPKQYDVNNSIITIANSEIFDNNIRFSTITDIGNILKENYTKDLTRRLESLFKSINGVTNAKVTITDMEDFLFCQKCTIEAVVKIHVSQNFSHTNELKRIIKNILLGLDLDIKENNITINIIK